MKTITIKTKGYYNLIFINSDSPCIVFIDDYGEQEVISTYYDFQQDAWFTIIKKEN